MYSFLLTLFLIVFNVHAAKVTNEEINKAATKWINTNSGFYTNSRNLVFSISEINNLYSESGEELPVVVVSMKPIGFIVMTTDDRMKPVLGFSFNSTFNFENKVENVFLFLIKSDVKNRMKILNEKPDSQFIAVHKQQWQYLLSGNTVLSPKTIYGPYLNSDWGQGYVSGNLVFNIYTPFHWPAGCVATGIAQVLNYYKWPPQGTGTHSYYEDDAGTLFVDYENTIYDWPNTLDIYTGVFTTQPQKNAAGLLTYHACVSVDMDFEQNGSTAETADSPAALHNYFRHSGHYNSVSTSGFWTAMQNNMIDGRPAILSIRNTSGLGHAAVVDGYSDGNDYYHLNPGWYGSSNGWYDISGTWNMSGYTIVNGAAKGIVPNPMIEDAIQVDSTTFVLPWDISVHQQAQYYEIQQATSQGGPWTTLNSSVPDTFYQVTVPQIGNYYYRIRTRRDDIWWDWSAVKNVQVGANRQITFQVNMSNRPLTLGETLVVRGNIAPLSGIHNSDPFTDPDSNGVYELTVDFSVDKVGDTLLYRFAVDTGAGIIIEDFNREYVINGEQTQVLPVVHFNILSAISDNKPGVPSEFLISQNYPNPFNSVTKIEFAISQNDNVSVLLYNLSGQKVETILNNKYYSKGVHEISVNMNQFNLATGIYFVQFNFRHQFRQIKILYLK